jgi:hypothetical protein
MAVIRFQTNEPRELRLHSLEARSVESQFRFWCRWRALQF